MAIEAIETQHQQETMLCGEYDDAWDNACDTDDNCYDDCDADNDGDSEDDAHAVMTLIVPISFHVCMGHWYYIVRQYLIGVSFSTRHLSKERKKEHLVFQDTDRHGAVQPSSAVEIEKYKEEQ